MSYTKQKSNPTIKTNKTTQKPDTIKLVMFSETQIDSLIALGKMTEKDKQELEKKGQIKHTKFANYTEDMKQIHTKVKQVCYVEGSNNGKIFIDKKGNKLQCMFYFRKLNK